jgi:hypothetical protein
MSAIRLFYHMLVSHCLIVSGECCISHLRPVQAVESAALHK